MYEIHGDCAKEQSKQEFDAFCSGSHNTSTSTLFFLSRSHEKVGPVPGLVILWFYDSYQR